MTAPRKYLDMDEILVDCYGEDEELSAWEVVFTDEIETPFPATLLGMPVEVTAFRLGPTNAIQCHIKAGDKQRWIGVEDLDEAGLPDDFLYYLDLYESLGRLMSCEQSIQGSNSLPLSLFLAERKGEQDMPVYRSRDRGFFAWAITGWLVAYLLCSVTPLAARQTPQTPVKKVSLHVTKGHFLPMLKSLCRQAGVKYRVTRAAEAMTPLYPITLHLDRAEFPLALIRLLRVSGMCNVLTFRVEQGVYVIRPGSVLHDQKITLTCKAVPLEAALTQVCDQVGASYVFALNGSVCQPVTCTLKEATLEEAVTRLLEAARPQPALTSKVYEEGIVTVYWKAKESEDLAQSRRRVTLDFQGDETYAALRALLNVSNQDFTLDSGLHYLKTTFSRKDVRILEAVEEIAHRSTMPLTYVLENGILSVLPYSGD